MTVRAILAYFQVAPSNHEDWGRGTASVRHRRAQANAVEWRRVLSLARSAHTASEAACQKMCK